MVIHGVFWFFCIGMSAVLHAHSLSLRVVLCLFHSPTSVLSSCIISRSLYVVTVYLSSSADSCVRYSLSLNISPQNHQLPRWSWLVDFYVSIVLGVCLRGDIHTALGVVLGIHFLSVLPGAVHTLPKLPLNRCIHFVIFIGDFICPQVPVISSLSVSWYILPCTSCWSGKIFHIHAHVPCFDVWYGTVNMEFYSV